MKLRGFILLEVLIALTIIGIASVIYWESSTRQKKLHILISQSFALERLIHDARILQSEKLIQTLDLKGYNGLELIYLNSDGLSVSGFEGEEFG